MLIIHSGFPKTGTTPLQQALSRSAPELSEMGYDYPDLFRHKDRVGHHAIPLALNAGGEAAHAVRKQALEYLMAREGRTVLLSSEAFTNCLSIKGFSDLMTFIEEAAGVMPVTWLCSMRRIDDFMQSMYLHQVKHGEVRTGIDEYIEARWSWMREKIRYLARIANSGAVQHYRTIKYSGAPEYMSVLEDAMGLVESRKEAIGGIPKGNGSLSLKQQTFLLHFEEFKHLLPQGFDAGMVRSLFSQHGFKFNADVDKYSIIPWEKRALLHESALRASLEFQETSYFDYFSQDEVLKSTHASLTKNALTPEDLQDFAGHCHAAGLTISS